MTIAPLPDAPRLPARAAHAARAAGLAAACMLTCIMTSHAADGSGFRPQRAAATAVPAAAADRADPAADADSGLRVVVVRGERTLASIDGRIVRVGDGVNGMRVARIDEHGVVLVGQNGARQTLAVSPQVKKRYVRGDGEKFKNGVRP